ncbi:MAG: hypothetical protein NTW87_13590 [Planctomycetota bacterium]|nr:hypothetical protein [Planctomycetota bacterium]
MRGLHDVQFWTRNPRDEGRATGGKGWMEWRGRCTSALGVAISRETAITGGGNGSRELVMIAPLRIALQALAANKLRSALTMLGNVIGVMCVVALVNIGISGRDKIQESLSSGGRST